MIAALALADVWGSIFLLLESVTQNKSNFVSILSDFKRYAGLEPKNATRREEIVPKVPRIFYAT